MCGRDAFSIVDLLISEKEDLLVVGEELWDLNPRHSMEELHAEDMWTGI